MQLLVGFFGVKASVNYIQIGHRRTAVEYARTGIKRHYQANLTGLFRRDRVFAEMEGMMQEWVVETLLQGAYLREYHLWEKDCKAYFSKMAERNQQVWPKPKGCPFTSHVRQTLGLYSVALPDAIFDAIEHMREQVNVMKHEAGLEFDHFIAEADYTTALDALEQFWELLTREERYRPDVA